MEFNARLQEFQTKLTALLDEYKFGAKEEVVFIDQLGNQHVFESPNFKPRMRIYELPVDEPKIEKPKKTKDA